MPTKWSAGGSSYSVDTWAKGWVTSPGRTEWEGAGFNHPTQNGEKFETYELFIPEFPI